VAELFVALRASRARLLPDLQEARGYVAAAAADMAGLVAGSMDAALGILAAGFRAIPGGLLVPLAVAVEAAGDLTSGFVTTVSEAAVNLAGGAATAARGALQAVAGAAASVGLLVGGTLIGVARGVLELVGPAAAVLSALGSLGKATLAGIVGAGITTFTGLLGVATLMIGQFKLGFSTLGAAASYGLMTAAAVARGGFAALAAVAGPILMGIGLLAKASLAGAVGTAVATFQVLIGVGAVMVGQFKAGFAAIGSGIGWAFTTATAVVRGTFEGVLSLVRGLAVGVGNVFSGMVSGVTGIFGGVVAVVSGIAAAVGGVLTGITGAVQAAVGGLRDLLEGVVSAAASAASSALELLARTAGAVLGPALSALSADLTDWSRWTAGAMQGETVAVRLATLIHAQGEAAGWSAAQLDVMARSMADLGTNSLGQIREAQLTLARFGNVRGLQFSGALEGARQLSALLGTELPAAAQMLGRALESPEHGMTALRRAGVILSENERHMVQWAARSGDVVGAQNVILGKLAQLGDVSGAVSETTAGHVNRLRITWESVGAAIGKAVMPFATIIVDFLQPIISGFAETMKAFFGGVAESGQGLLASVRGWIAENKDLLTSWGRMIGDVVAGVILLIRDGFAAAAAWVAAKMGATGDSTAAALADVPRAITNVLATVRAAVQNAGLAWDIFTSYAQSAFSSIRDRAVNLITFMGKMLEATFESSLAAVRHAFDDKVAEMGAAWLKLPFTRVLMPEGTTSESYEADLKKIAADTEESAGRAARARIALAKSELAKAEAAAAAGKTDAGLEDKIARFRQLVEEARAEANRPPPRVEAQRTRDAAQDRTPTPQAVEEVQVKFGMAGFGDMWKNIQRSITGTSPEALARANINAINGVKGSVDGVGGKVDNLLNWFRNNRNQGGFGP
jgi:hypothetical protein